MICLFFGGKGGIQRFAKHWHSMRCKTLEESWKMAVQNNLQNSSRSALKVKILFEAGATKSVWSLNEAPRLQAANHALKNFRELGHVIGQAVALHAIAKAEIWVAEVKALGISQRNENRDSWWLFKRDIVGYKRVIASIMLWFLHRVPFHVRYLVHSKSCTSQMVRNMMVDASIVSCIAIQSHDDIMTTLDRNISHPEHSSRHNWQSATRMTH